MITVNTFLSDSYGLLSKLYEQEELRLVLYRLLEEYLHLSQTDVLFLDKDTLLSPEVLDKLTKAVQRLGACEPLQYILGYTDFYGLRIGVAPGVLIPRPETEELIYIIKEDFKDSKDSTLCAIDIGTGSACIPIALCSQIGDKLSSVDAIDLSTEALVVAEKNLNSFGLGERIRLQQADLFALDICDAPYDIMVSNPPYIHPDEATSMSSQVLHWEPGTALFAPSDSPIVYYEAIARLISKGWLKPNGRLYLELNPLYAELTRDSILSTIGESRVGRCELLPDMSGKERFLRLLYKG